MNADNRNLITAIALSMLILIVYQVYFIPDTPAPQDQGYAGQTVENLPATPGSTQLAAASQVPAAVTAPRVAFDGAGIKGSISLAKGRIDDLRLKDYGVDTLTDENRVPLLRKSGADDSYFTEVDFLDGTTNAPLIGADVIWQSNGGSLTPSTPLTLTHDNGNGLSFALTYTMDDDYMITMDAAVTNTSGNAVSIRHLARLLRNKPTESAFFISYEGPLGVFEEDVKVKVDYDDIEELNVTGESHQSDNVKGWIGITDKYWLTALIPARQDDVNFTFRRAPGAGLRTQVDALTGATTIADGATLTRSFALFAGPKQVDVLEAYNDSQNIERLDHAIDWGWFPFLTKPFYFAIHWLFVLMGNFGLAIIGVTVIVKVAFFPLANKSYKSMAKMRELAPKVTELRERFADDKPRQQQEMMQLYRAEKVNPAAGCLPVLLQIPVFFALYKVLFISIEMRHAPFYGWITDLSALDPTSILNLFGLLPYSTAAFPDFMNLGVWPILMGISMYVQMSLNPPPPDPIQAKIFKFMPLFFTFLLATFPAGLVIYWTWNNLLSILQQWYIMQSMKKAKTA
ncbi:MAG: membrane protein insertase YidC [Alphaproteobacteria bacterium]|nr:membrane protein insertase YidC [Alphaproteobacteria bacterium]